MTEFSDAMGKSLSVWDDYKQDSEYYNNLSWSGGMITSSEFAKLTAAKKKKIKDAILAEGDAVNKALNKAKGERCN